jgi:hypothetical protein
MMRWWCAALAGSLLTAGQASAGEGYFLLVFAAQNHRINWAHEAHSFATFVKVCGEGDQLENYRIETITISWLPVTETVKVRRLLPETGVNLGLPETLRWASELGLDVSMWGPYQIQKSLYDKASEQKAHLESGTVRYKAVDTAYPTAHVSNCIHAVSDLGINTARLRLGTPAWGDSASYWITRSLRPSIIDENQTHDWLLGPLGLAGQPITRRDLETNPSCRPVQRFVQSVFHRSPR